MTSLSGTKERSVTSRSRKYGVPDTSPTKSASFSPETWYRKAYEESSRGSMRPAPEGAGSMPSSTGTPSPGSGTSSPGSFSGSPGTVSPGIGTGSPGSLGGSPGFGTGSPASGSGSSPGSERGGWCENCNARLAELKRQALKLLIPGPYSSKDPSFTLLIHDKLQVPNSSRRAWNERDSRCDVCSTHLAQLKQEAVHMVLTLDHWDLSPTSSPTALLGRFALQGPQGSAPFAPPAHQPPPLGSAHRLGSKPSSLGLGGAVDRRSASPSQGKSAGSQQQQGSSGNSHGNSNSSGAVLSTAVLQAHQHLTRTSGGVTLYPYQISQMISEASREEMTEAALNRHNTHSPSHTHTNSHSNTNSPSHTPPVTTAAPTTATSTAASFFVRAAQKLNLASKKKKQKGIAAVTAPVTSSSPACDPPLFPTNFSSALLVAPPPAPPCLLRAANKIKDTPGLGKVKVMVRVCPVSQSDPAESSSFLKVDPRKKQITIMEPSANHGTSKRAGSNQVPPKIFAFDAAFPHDASQAEVCAGTVAEVIQSVVNGADGCVFCFGHSKLGKSYTMIGQDDSLQTLGIIPCAISWLFKLINERKEKTGARFSVRVSAVEVWGKEENLKDLLSEVATGSLQDGQSPGVYLCEDPICGMQLQNQSELRAPTPEKAAWFLDAAIAARHSSQRSDTTEEEHRNSHMLFTLHIYQYRMEKTGKGGMSGGRSRLHLLDLGSCDVKALIGGGAAGGGARGGGAGGGGGGGKGKESSSTGPAPLCLSLSALGNVILALVNGSKHIPYKDSKLTMLLRESLGNMNCRTTMIAHISASTRDFSETLFTIQIASRVLRMKKKKTKYTSSSSGGESSCEEGRMRRPTHLRPFHHRGDACEEGLQLLRLASDPDEYSSSEQSCDTVIYVGPSGAAVSDRELTDNEGPPEFVPVIPVLLRGKAAEQPQQPPPPSPAQSQAECLKCNTFAELQERLDCIDGSEEVAKFPFEEVPPTTKPTKQDPDSASPVLESADPAEPLSSSPEDSRRRTNDQQLQEIRDVVEEAELAHTMIHSLAHGSGSSLVSGARSVTGSSSTAFNPLQRTKSSGLHDSRESLAGGMGESKTRPLGSPRLGIASLTKTSEYRPPSSPSQRCKVYTQKGVIPGTPPHSSHTLAQDNQAAEAVTPPDNSVAADSGRSSTDSVLSRASPVGMSLQVQEPAARCLSTSHGSAETLCDDEVPQIPLDVHREGHAGTLSPVGQLSLGEDELVFTMGPGGEVALDAMGMLEARGLDGRPASMVSFTSDCCLVTARGSGPVPVSIISSIGGEAGHLEHYGGSAVTTSRAGLTEVVAMAKLRLEGEALTTVMPSCGPSISSWLSDLSVGSEAEQSLHSFSQTQSQEGEALADPDPIHSLSSRVEVPGELINNSPAGPQRRGSQEGEMLLSEGGSERGGGTLTKERLKTLPHSVGKAGMQSLGRPGNFSPLRTIISVHPCLAVKPMMIQEPTILSSQTRSGFNKDLAKPGSAQAQGRLATISSEMNFEDPWLRRGREGMRSEELACNVKAEMRKVEEAKILVSSPRRVVDGCEKMTAVTEGDCLTSLYNPDIHRTASLPRGWHRVNRYDGLDTSSEYRNLGVTTSTPCSPQATLDRRGCRQGFFSHKRGGIPPLPPVRKSSLDQRNRAAGPPLSPLHQPSYGLSFLGSSAADDMGLARQRGPSADSSRLFSAKLEQLANRTNSLGRAHGPHSGIPQYDCFSLERGGSLKGGGGGGGGRGGGARGDSTMPRTGRSLTRAGSVSSPHGHASISGGSCFISVPGTCSAPQSPAKGSSQSKISAVSKLLMASSPKSRSLSASSTKTLSISTKSLPQAFNRSSSLPPNAKSPSSSSWSTQSLSRSRGGSLATKLPLRAVNGRISELLQGSASTRARGHAQAGRGAAVQAEEKPAVVQTLPSPYSKITAPRKPQRCSSGHASDNSSVLSGELPPAMGKTALFYHSGGSSGYESMLRDSSENTGSNSSAQDSVSEHSSATTSSRRSSKTSKKSRSSTGLQRRRLIPALTLDSSSSSPTHRSSKATTTSSSSSSSSPSACWVDGPLGPPASPSPRGGVSATESFEIKVYEIDDVERMQRRREKGSKEVMHVGAKHRLLVHRQQRITELRAKYQGLKKELEQTKQHLMLEPRQWTTEFELQQAYELDSLEYLEALEMVTFKLETRVNFCKAHLMMITCFDVSSKRR
ncbi:unnamed protein product [Lota lota]